MDDLYVPDLNIQLLEKDILDCIFELQNDSKKINSSINSLITTTDLLKSGWKTNEGVVVTDEVKRLTSSLESLSKKMMMECNNIPTNISYKID